MPYVRFSAVLQNGMLRNWTRFIVRRLKGSSVIVPIAGQSARVSSQMRPAGVGRFASHQSLKPFFISAPCRRVFSCRRRRGKCLFLLTCR